MKRQIIKGSKLLFSEGYNPETRILEVRFWDHDHNPGKVYRYLNVSPETYAEWKTSPSAGKYFLSAIKPKHECERMPDAKAEAETQDTEAEAPEATT